ncbi:hypothetical protein [Sphaerotilus mobilis]|uniref:Uncharacterized protein n=1 Tax=Sphaerotilus mobilis TaxID=47994 RepID=A0A4Q7LQT5_9BURK|nr:hypothetical protein [Sphaerotilus mobilis]RZS56721.1 hypothetical protein EV685_1275 [Sphaerotilus mobilis]
MGLGGILGGLLGGGGGNGIANKQTETDSHNVDSHDTHTNTYTHDQSGDNSHNYSSNYESFTGTDPGLANMWQMGTQLLQAQGEAQGDAFRIAATMGTEAIRTMGDMTARSEANSAQVRADAADALARARSDVNTALNTADAAGAKAAATVAGSGRALAIGAAVLVVAWMIVKKKA